MSASDIKGLIAHDWIERAGGAERVLESMCAAFPSAQVATLWSDGHAGVPVDRVTESWLANTPLRGRKALAVLAMPPTWARLSTAGAEWVLSSSHAFAHHVGHAAARADIPSFVYAHTPARYLWAPEFDVRGQNAAARAMAPVLRRVDCRAAQTHARVAANSAFIRERISQSWGIDSQVIHPPVDVDPIRDGEDRDAISDQEWELIHRLPSSFVLGASRLVAYKRLDLVIRAAELAQLPAVIVGSGPDEERIRTRAAAASVPVILCGYISDAALREILRRSSLFVFPPVEDFGILAVEAQAAGTPVVVNRHGGAKESIVEAATGFAVDFGDEASLSDAIDAALRLDRSECVRHASSFARARFEREIREFVVGGG